MLKCIISSSTRTRSSMPPLPRHHVFDHIVYQSIARFSRFIRTELQPLRTHTCDLADGDLQSLVRPREPETAGAHRAFGRLFETRLRYSAVIGSDHNDRIAWLEGVVQILKLIVLHLRSLFQTTHGQCLLSCHFGSQIPRRTIQEQVAVLSCSVGGSLSKCLRTLMVLHQHHPSIMRLPCQLHASSLITPDLSRRPCSNCLRRI